MIALKDALTPKNLAWTKAPTRVTVNAVTQITRGNPGFSTVIEAWWPYRNSIGDIAGRDDVVFNIVLDDGAKRSFILRQAIRSSLKE